MTGFDFDLVRQCCPQTKRSIITIHVLLAGNVLLMLGSALYAFHHLFDGWFATIALAIFITLAISNTFLLLLTTFFKNVLPVARNKQDLHTARFTLFGRVAFILFIAVIFAKPIEHFAFSYPLSGFYPLRSELEDYKTAEIARETQKINRFLGDQISNYEQSIAYLQELQRRQPDPDLLAEIQRKQKRIDALIIKKNTAITQITQAIRDSPHFIRAILLLNRRHHATWGITALVATLFLTPFLMVLGINEKSDYFRMKRQRDRALVEADYARFRQAYALAIRKYKPDWTFTERYLDPPYNTRKIEVEKVIHDQKSLIRAIYHE